MQSIWFIHLQGKKEGPYSVEQLIQDPRVEFDTLVWKKGMKEWTPLYKLKELQIVLKEKKKKQGKVQPPEKKKDRHLGEVLVETGRFNPPPFLWALFFLGLLLAYIIIKVFFS